jgi:hypothetical protein
MTADYTFFSEAHGTFSKVDHILSHKENFKKSKKMDIICILTDHNGIKLEINRKTTKNI